MSLAHKVLGATVFLCVIAGCQTTTPGPYPWSEGWREATVLRVGPANTLFPSAWVDCRRSLSPEVVSSRQFAEVQYGDMGTRRRAVVLLQPGARFQPEDKVLFNLKDCKKALQAG